MAEIPSVWPQCEGRISEALKYTTNPDIGLIHRLLMNGEADLWHGEKSSAVTCFVGNPRILNILAVAGEDMEEWISVAISDWAKFAKEYSCVALIASGRPGWRNVFKENGFKITHITGLREV